MSSTTTVIADNKTVNDIPVAEVDPATAPALSTHNHLDTKASTQLLPSAKFITHHPKAGINPLVDAAAYLFSVVGKLKKTKAYRNLSKLHNELVKEIHAFQDSAKAHGYTSEYILVGRYALCATIDDTIMNTSWGAQGQWDSHSLLSAFNQEPPEQDRFFVILERISKDSSLYIDVMELMYICLSLGFKGSYKGTEYSNSQLEQMTHTLYKRIRSYHGDFNKTLSPYPIKQAPAIKPIKKNTSIIFTAIVSACIVLAIFISLGYLLDTVSNQAYRELMTIGKSILYESNP